MTRRCDLTGVGAMSGNNVSKSKRRTRRSFVPNLKEVSLKSEALGGNVSLKVAANVLRISYSGSTRSIVCVVRTSRARFLKKRERGLGVLYFATCKIPSSTAKITIRPLSEDE